MNYKKWICTVLLLSICFSPLFAKNKHRQQIEESQLLSMALDEVKDETTFKLYDVDFESSGKTKSKFVDNNLSPINYDLVFNNKAELIKYVEAIHQELTNTRLFENIQYTIVIVKIDEDIHFVDVKFTFDDSNSILVLPKPAYNSNSGANLKVKLKDNNFLGLMNPLGIDTNIQLGTTDTPQDFSKVTVGVNFDYTLPFNVGETKNSWSNSVSFGWLIGDPNPEFGYSTGLVCSIPIKEHAIELSATQGITRENDYIKYGDEVYFTDTFGIGMPLVIGHIGKLTQIKYTPSISSTLYWDINGLSPLNDDLYYANVVKAGGNFSTKQVNWNKNAHNFRKGFYASTGHYAGWLYSKETFKEGFAPYVDGTFQFFANNNWIGFNSQFYFYAGYNQNINIGSMMRGALDNQVYSSNPAGLSNVKALTTPQALVLNMEFPIHVISTNWLGWGEFLFGKYEDRPKFGKAVTYIPYKIGKYLDFELQVVPFLDMALLTDRQTGQIFNPQKGIYNAGLEMLVFPTKFNSYVVRLSVGYDIGQKLDKYLPLDNSWRSNWKNYEISFGLGTHF